MLYSTDQEAEEEEENLIKKSLHLWTMLLIMRINNFVLQIT